MTGEVVARERATVNAALATGEIDLKVEDLSVLSEAEELPLPVFAEPDYPEDVRLKYRFLDLRRETLHANIVKRTQIIASMRRRMHEAGFTEFSTPILTASSPEGARDFLVPSRIHQGKFFALPQAPQQYKQLLMVAGFDRYFQIAPCFRDEDPRADRLPGEFYQLDLEMSFVTQEDVWDTMEPVLRGVFEEFGAGKPVTQKFPRIPYDTAIRKYGSDKPDLRNPIEMDNVSEHFRGSGFKVFAGMLEKDPRHEVWAIPASGGGSRAFCDKMNSWAQQQGQPGLGYIFWREGEEGGAGPIAKNLGPERTEAIRLQLDLKVGDAVFFAAGDPRAFYKFAGEARNRVASELQLTQTDQFACCWIVDFPFYEYNEEEKRIDFAHNPFSMPQGGIEALNSAADPLSLKAFQYDMVCNGYEIASGSIRNADPGTMVRAFEITGLSKADVEDQFGGMYRAFQFGAPPHGGMAAGVDRIVMLICGAQNLREITLFPMNQQAQDLLMGAPSEAPARHLRELGIRTVDQR
jgi:aspartyl-tRNA synthetase